MYVFSYHTPTKRKTDTFNATGQDSLSSAPLQGTYSLPHAPDHSPGAAWEERQQDAPVREQQQQAQRIPLQHCASPLQHRASAPQVVDHSSPFYFSYTPTKRRETVNQMPYASPPRPSATTTTKVTPPQPRISLLSRAMNAFATSNSIAHSPDHQQPQITRRGSGSQPLPAIGCGNFSLSTPPKQRADGSSAVACEQPHQSPCVPPKEPSPKRPSLLSRLLDPPEHPGEPGSGAFLFSYTPSASSSRPEPQYSPGPASPSLAASALADYPLQKSRMGRLDTAVPVRHTRPSPHSSQTMPAILVADEGTDGE